MLHCIGPVRVGISKYVNLQHHLRGPVVQVIGSPVSYVGETVAWEYRRCDWLKLMEAQQATWQALPFISQLPELQSLECSIGTDAAKKGELNLMHS